MTSEAQAPDALLVHAGWSGTPAVTDIDDDPDGPDDGNWLVASDNNTSTEARVSFPTPSDGLTAGADLQEFRARVRQFDGGQTGTPTARLELWEAGTLVRAGAEANITSTTGQVISLTWNASEISAAADVECKVVGIKSGGAPTARNTVDLGAVEWVAQITIGDVVVSTDGASHSQAAEAATLVQVHDLAVAGAGHTHSAAAGSFGQLHDLAIGEGTSGHAAGTPDISQIHDLAVVAAEQNNSALGTSFVQIHELSIDGAEHAEGAEIAAFTQNHDLAPGAAGHTHLGGTTSFDQIHFVVAAGAGHDHSAATASFAQIFNLEVDDALTTQVLAGPEFGQIHLLGALDALHAQDSPGMAIAPQPIPGPPAAFLGAARAAPSAAASEGGHRIKASLS